MKQAFYVYAGVIEPAPALEDERGTITNLVHHAGNVAIIRSVAGSKRSGHWHQTDSHWLYVVSGCMQYREGDQVPVEVHAGQMIFTGPNVKHWTEFPVDTVLVAMNEMPQTTHAHEADVVRVHG